MRAFQSFRYRHVLGVALVLGGVAANVIIKERRKKAALRSANKTNASVDKVENGRRRSEVDASAGRIRLSNGKGMGKKLDGDGAAVDESASAPRLGGLGWSEREKSMRISDCSDGGRVGDDRGAVRVGSGERNAHGVNGNRLAGGRSDVWAVSCRASPTAVREVFVG